MRRRENETDGRNPAGDMVPADGAAAPSPTTEEFEKYLVHLADLDMPLAMKIELIRTVGIMMQSFVDRAFGDDPVQMAKKPRDGRNKKDTERAPPVLNSQPDTQDNPKHLTSGFGRNSGPRGEKATTL